MKAIELLRKDFEFCSFLSNPYEDLEIVYGTVDFISCDLYISGVHLYSCGTLTEMLDYLPSLGLEVTVIKQETLKELL